MQLHKQIFNRDASMIISDDGYIDIECISVNMFCLSIVLHIQQYSGLIKRFTELEKLLFNI